ncbi:PIN domain-containing protein [bacterium]|nr:MAG: PIN domain-containing protein [bacterium]
MEVEDKRLHYIDSNVFIYTLEGEAMIRKAGAEFFAHHPNLLTSQLTEMECVILPIRQNDLVLLSQFDSLFSAVQFQVLSREILLRAAQLRADYRFLKTPDAIHAVTALELNFSLFVSNDPVFAKVPGLIVRTI